MNDEYIQIRNSHLLRHCSVGAIVRGPDFLMTIKDIRYWIRPGESMSSLEIPYVDQIKSALDLTEKKLCHPPIRREINGYVSGWIPTVRFPKWMQCTSSNCGLLHYQPWKNQDNEKLPKCQAESTSGKICGQKLEQIPWVLVHEKGFMADVPWHDIAHENESSCHPDWKKPYLHLTTQSEGLVIYCNKCRSRSKFQVTMQFYPKNSWQQPWDNRQVGDETDGQLGWVMEINDVRVHSSVNKSALVIPPESRIHRGTVVDRLYASSEMQDRIRRARQPRSIQSAFRIIASKLRCNKSDVEEAWEKIQSGYPLFGKSFSHSNWVVDEYKALTNEIPDLEEGEDFVTQNYPLGGFKNSTERNMERVAGIISKLVAVKRLRMIEVLTGFTRVHGENVPPDINGECDWLPALELRGEGVFFELNEKMLQRWENQPRLKEKVESFQKRFEQSTLKYPKPEDITARFILLHTLSHSLIRQFEVVAGYPASALKERIYSRTGASSIAGILIYIAVPDKEGTLGGLVELAKPSNFIQILKKAFDAASWCSMDPVCSEQEGHGPELLNYAACHACMLLPEPSCSCQNNLLDRTLFMENDSDQIKSLLEFVDY